MLTIVVMSFLFDMGSYLLALAMGFTVESMPVFIVYSLVPSMILNFYGCLFSNIFENVIYKKEIKCNKGVIFIMSFGILVMS